MNLAKKHADEIREMWQSRVLRASAGKLRKIVISAFAKSYRDALKTLLAVTFEGFQDIDRPIIASYGHIATDGSVIADMVDRAGVKRKTRLYESEGRFLYEARKVADELKLSDDDRRQMFGVLQRWIVSDQRIGTEGQRLVS